jgi:ATP-binding cassette subfamily B multidrug efflux pump
MITGMLRPTNGKVLFNGHDWTRKDLEQIGALIETPPLYDNLSAAENLEVRAKLLGVPKARIDEVLEIVDLQNTGRKKAGQFSMGMKQRLGIAIALLNNPKLLILDDALSAVDAKTEQLILSNLKALRHESSTLVVSHRLSSVMEANEILVLDEGKVIERGLHEDLIKSGGWYAQMWQMQQIESHLTANDEDENLLTGSSVNREGEENGEIY